MTEEVFVKILNACRKAKEEGITVSVGTYGAYEGSSCMCPLSCVIYTTSPEKWTEVVDKMGKVVCYSIPNYFVERAAAEILDITLSDAIYFVKEYDKNPNIVGRRL